MTIEHRFGILIRLLLLLMGGLMAGILWTDFIAPVRSPNWSLAAIWIVVGTLLLSTILCLVGVLAPNTVTDIDFEARLIRQVLRFPFGLRHETIASFDDLRDLTVERIWTERGRKTIWQLSVKLPPGRPPLLLQAFVARTAEPAWALRDAIVRRMGEEGKPFRCPEADRTGPSRP